MTDSETKSLQDLIDELPANRRALVREFAEYLHGLPPRPEEPDRPPEPGPEAQVSLREITADTVRTICQLSDTLPPPKKWMVAPNAISIAQAHFEPHAWFRAIYAGETPVGFIMLYDGGPDQDEPDRGPVYFLWRFMIAGPHHGKGYGRRAIELLVDYVKTRPEAKELIVSCGEGPGSPEGFYKKLGFARSGRMYDREVGLVMKL